MPYVLFHDQFPEIAERETRTVTGPAESSCGLPPGDYSLLEMFCDEPKCDSVASCSTSYRRARGIWRRRLPMVGKVAVSTQSGYTMMTQE